ncbi:MULTISPECIES: c-type cytochrome biogenesis protein CcsB [Gulosibacter]|uniref:c-type cytochrome biogenesis protein CcsB n=1 Tax=Gulosibacter TaxID=256818 RepID=UPI000F640035|nr:MULTISPECIES: c-type cytochrome biogenesis protein CcsB [Gulosibacter]
MIESLINWSDIAYYVAMGVYALAFILFALDLSGRGSTEAKRAAAARNSGSALGATSRELVGATVSHADASGAGIVTSKAPEASSSGGTAVRATRAGGGESWRDLRATRFLPAAMVATLVGFAAHFTSALTLGLAAGRVPWSNMYEFTLTATLLIVLVFLVSQLWQDLRFLGTFITGMVTLFLGIATVGFRVEVMPLQPALQSYWLVIHVFIASLATGFLALGSGLSVLQLLQQRREARVRAGEAAKRGPLSALPGSERLEDLAFRVNVVGFIFWTFTLVAGAIWAEAAWGRYWGWDTKEVWTFIIWVVYAGYLHARSTKGWRGTPSAWLAIVGFATVMFNFGIVNVFFKGLHSYSGL